MLIYFQKSGYLILKWISTSCFEFLVLNINAVTLVLNFQIVGHSLGGGTAALLTYILREQKELSSSTCVTFAPGVCLYAPVADLCLKVERFIFLLLLWLLGWYICTSYMRIVGDKEECRTFSHPCLFPDSLVNF